MISFKEFLTERIGPAAIEAKKLGLKWYGSGQWGKGGKVLYRQYGIDKLEKIANPSKVSTKDFDRKETVNGSIDNKKWALLGSGAQSTVWNDLMADNSDSVVKVSGGGTLGTDQDTDLAFIHFLIDHGRTNKHLPIIIDINTDDVRVVQIKMEKLVKLPGVIPKLLERLHDAVVYGTSTAVKAAAAILKKSPRFKEKLAAKNDVEDIIKTIELLNKNTRKYGKMYKSHDIVMDLHTANWLMRPDGTIVAADPWFGG